MRCEAWVAVHFDSRYLDLLVSISAMNGMNRYVEDVAYFTVSCMHAKYFEFVLTHGKQFEEYTSMVCHCHGGTSIVTGSGLRHSYHIKGINWFSIV